MGIAAFGLPSATNWFVYFREFVPNLQTYGRCRCGWRARRFDELLKNCYTGRECALSAESNHANWLGHSGWEGETLRCAAEDSSATGELEARVQFAFWFLLLRMNHSNTLWFPDRPKKVKNVSLKQRLSTVDSKLVLYIWIHLNNSAHWIRVSMKMTCCRRPMVSEKPQLNWHLFTIEARTTLFRCSSVCLLHFRLNYFVAERLLLLLLPHSYICFYRKRTHHARIEQ